MLERGTVIGNKYRIVEMLGKGGQGSVYLARDQSKSFKEKSEVAIKEIHQGKTMSGEMVNIQFFQQEVMTLMQLNTEYLPKIIDFFQSGQKYYLVEDYIEGKTLEELLSAGKPSLSRALDIALKIADILDFLHQQDPPIYYRDLKPSNVIVQPGKLVLVDFSGCYIPLMGFGEGVKVYSHGYSPPEAKTSAIANPSYDVYTLGMVLYEMVTGENMGAFQGTPPPLRPEDKNIPSPICNIINKAIQKNPKDRFPTIWQMKQELQKVSDELRKSGVAVSNGNGKTNGNGTKVDMSGYKMKRLLASAFSGLMTIFLFLAIPGILTIPALKPFLPWMAGSADGIPFLLLIPFFFALIFHLLWNHWLDNLEFVGRLNRHLHFPSRIFLNLPPILLMILAELILVVNIYINILK